MPPNAAIPMADTGESGDLAGSQTTEGRDGGTPAVTVNPREGTAQALADAVMSALRAGDLIAAHAASKALEAFVGVLGGSTQQVVPNIGAERRSRDGKSSR
jgi:hypothetical protein